MSRLRGGTADEVRAALARYDDRFDDYWGFLEPRIAEVWRLLAADGTLYLRLDAREAHYAKVMLDALVGRDGFMNEIVWVTGFGEPATAAWPRRHDTILVYARDPKRVWFDASAVDREPYMAPGLVTPEKAALGKLPTDVWWHTIVGGDRGQAAGSARGADASGTDAARGATAESAAGASVAGADGASAAAPDPGADAAGGAPAAHGDRTPEGVVRRILQASSREGDLVLDPFAGSGTTGVVAATLGRRFVLIEDDDASVAVMRARFAELAGVEFDDGPGRAPASTPDPVVSTTAVPAPEEPTV
nr:site-specific DNA-methyltransferase [Agromyces archimandritae]